jgi:hypothetical protein
MTVITPHNAIREQIIDTCISCHSCSVNDFVSGTGIKIALAQVNPMVTAKDQGGGNTTSTSMSNMAMSTSGGMANKTTVARDSQTILLEGKIIPGKGFIHLYDSTPYMMNAGYVALHNPCGESSKPIVNTLIGQSQNSDCKARSYKGIVTAWQYVLMPRRY